MKVHEMLALSGFANLTLEQIHTVNEELDLSGVAFGKLPSTCMPPHPELVVEAAIERAWETALRKVQPNGNANTLKNYLKWQILVWTSRYAQHDGKGKQIPRYDYLSLVSMAHMPAPIRMDDSEDEDFPKPDVSSVAAEVLVLDTVAAVLQQKSFTFERDASGIRLTMRCGDLLCPFQWRFAGDSLYLRGTLPVFACELWRSKAVLAVNAANWKVLLGNFEIDPSDGEMVFRVSMPLEGSLPSVEQVERLLAATCRSLEKYGMALIEAGITDHDWAALIARCE